MKIRLDKTLVDSLRHKFNENQNFSYNITSEFHIPSQKKGTKENKNAFNCLCAALDRMSDIVSYLNRLDIQNENQDGVFQLCDFLNQAQTLIDCIDIFGRIYNVPYRKESDISSFHQKGLNEKGNDTEYFKYLRSLCSVHPISTNAHPEYQGDEPEWCPYIRSKNAMSYLFDNEIKKADFVATVYRNDTNANIHIPIIIKQIFDYLEKRYEYINKIIDAINKYNQEQVNSLRLTLIEPPSSYPSYDDYIYSLSTEFLQRCGSCEYYPKIWRATMHTHFQDLKWEAALNEYKAELRIGIERIHRELQDMSCLNENFDPEAIKINTIERLNDFSYEDNETEYLFPDVEIENTKNHSETFIFASNSFDKERLSKILKFIDDQVTKGATHKDLRDICRQLDSQIKISDSEWARIQLKIMESVIGTFLPFDYYLNDWHLYLQIQIAKWKIGQAQK